jgi:hypothetical protein
MGDFRKDRYDYFLIWGNGLQCKKEIISIVRNARFIKILKIMNHRPKSIAKLVRTIYSYDYAPFHHLKSKTRYLLQIDPDVVFVFIHNENAQEMYRGTGAFRHIECARIKRIKEEIRNKFNPRKNGKRTEEHVIHASDNESQVDHILRYLGFKNGLDYLKNVPNPLLSLPHYLPNFAKFIVRQAHISQLYGTVVRGTRDSFRTKVVELDQMPQFACLTGDVTAYQEYLSEFLGGPLTFDYSVEKLMRLSQNLVYLEEPYTTSYILTKEFGLNQYLILDGVHRACILKFRNVNQFPIAVMR